MTDSRSTPEDFMAQIREEVRKLPPGSDVAGFITRKCAEMNRLLAQELAEQREEAASDEADFPPSAMPPLRSSGDEENKGAAPPHDPSA